MTTSYLLPFTGKQTMSLIWECDVESKVAGARTSGRLVGSDGGL
jgi:hypothetical protein